MNLVEFQQLSKRTMPFGGEPANQQEFENMLGNYAMGLVGEIIELQHELTKINNDEKIALEIGDVAHYAIGLMTLSKNEVFEHAKIPLFTITDEESISVLLSNAGEIVEHAKKVIYHRHDFESKILIKSWRILSVLKLIIKKRGYKFSNVLDMNINKLKTRYPESFSVEDSIARKDVQG